jgi:predicted amidohydrolase
LLVTVIQINSSEDKKKNLIKTESFLEKAYAEKPDVIVLPEYTNYMGPLSHAAEAGESPEGSIWYKRLSDFSSENSVDIIAGIIRRAEDGKAVSCAVHFSKNASVPVEYKKMHLFDIDLDQEVTIKESMYLMAGDIPLITEVDNILCGYALCYDLRFPELFRRLTLQGVRVVFLLAAFTHRTGEAHWESLVKARAIENEIFIVAANQVGPYGKGNISYGNSMIVDPWGSIIARAPGIDGPEKECVINGELDFSYQDKVREELPCLGHIRKDIFSL